jgi:hypothetical protein
MLALRHPNEFDTFASFSGFAQAMYVDDGVPESIEIHCVDVWRQAFVDALPWPAGCLGLTVVVPLVMATCRPGNR